MTDKEQYFPEQANGEAGDAIENATIEWLLKVEASPKDPEVQAALDTWLKEDVSHQAAYARIANVWNVAGDLAPPKSQATVANGAADTKDRPFWESLARQLALRFGGIPYPAGVAALAVALVLIVVPVSQWFSPTEELVVRTEIGEIANFELEDGSTLYLDAATSLRADFTRQNRHVSLNDGHVFFDVAEDTARPFIVSVDGLTIQVTGTSFSVGTGKRTAFVSVASGSVEATPSKNSAERFDLTPGEHLSMVRASGAVTKSRVAVEAIGAWRNGEMIVEALPLIDLVERLEHHYDGKIELDAKSLEKRLITGVFDLTHPKAALEAAVATQNAEVNEVYPGFLLVTKRQQAD